VTPTDDPVPSAATRRRASARLGVRLARRELRRRPWRAVLVILLVFLPTAIMSGAVTTVRTAERSSDDERDARWGQAEYSALPVSAVDEPALDDVARAEKFDEQLARLRAALPPGGRLLIENQRQDRVRQGERRTYLWISDLPLDHPTARGMTDAVQGRLPRKAGEAVLSDTAAHDLGLTIGDTFTPDRLDRALTVVGTVTVRAGTDPLVFTAGPLRGNQEAGVLVDLHQPTRILVDLPEGADPVPPVPGWELVTSDWSTSAGNSEEVLWTYVAGGIGLIVLGTIITAAFAVGARRQLRSVGLLASSGAAPATIRWFLVAQGTVAGALGSIAGVVVGVGAVALGLRTAPDDVITRALGWPVERAVVRPAELLPVIVIGTVASSVAAWLPARSAAQVPTLQALAGRRPLAQVPARLPLLGALSVTAGCALLALAVVAVRSSQAAGVALVAIAGGLAVMLGAIATAPWVIAGLEPVSGRLPQAWRLAGRGLSRNRVRSSAVVGAICAVTITLVAGATLDRSLDDRSAPASLPYLRDDQIVVDSANGAAVAPEPVPADLVRRIQAIVPTGSPIRLTRLASSMTGTDPDGTPTGPPMDFVPVRDEDTDLLDDYRWFGSVGVASPELLDLLKVPGDLREALERGTAVGVAAPPYESSSITLHGATSGGVSEPGGPVSPGATLPLRSFESPEASRQLPNVLISRATAEKLGFSVLPGWETLFVARSPLTDRQRDRLDVLARDLEWERTSAYEASGATTVAPPLYLHVTDGPPGVSPAQVRAGALGVALLFVLAVVAVGLALAKQDGEDEAQVLVAVGAPPRTVRRTAALRAVLLVLVAGVISVPAGLLPAAAIVATTEEYGRRAAFRPDPWAVLFALVVVPAIVGLVTWSGGRLRDLVRPARPDVFAFGD
jgi:putative ABC transport system permease protein